ncbi:MAG TPA: cupin domain-containing protein [Methylomirabilota bacterium]|nr:cupin domain-containing protein [Methylomirabilota bacterium]
MLPRLLIPALLLVARALGAQPADPPVIVDPSTAKFQVFPSVPACFETAVLRGDASQGPSAVLVRAQRACAIPLHWHTPNENIEMISGVGIVTMKDGSPLRLKAGAYAYLPSRHPHVFACAGACLLFIYQDAPFDIHYVDENGREIPLEQARQGLERERRKSPGR